MNLTTGANEFTAEELEELFRDDFEQETPPATDNTVPEETTDDKPDASEGEPAVENTTKAFARRLRESTEKARREERENIAKSFGYASYDEMQKERERQMFNDKGFDPDEVSPIVDEIVKKRLEEDPRMEELERLRSEKLKEFGKKELAEITKLTGGKITSLAQLSSEVIDLWKQKGSLKKAFLEVEGEKLITEIRGEQSKGSTSHLATPGGSSSGSVKERPLTDEERRMFKFFNPNMTDEELNKKRIKT